MRNKSGPPGQQGPSGDRGDKGEAGKCDADCRDQYCHKRLLDPDVGIIPTKLRELNQGESVQLNNIYIKSKVHQICGSDEFKQLAPYNGAGNLVSYLEEIWKMWIEEIYKSGGALYFKTIGAEEEFDWQADNPFDEIKKYDVFYWGMGRQYRPKIIDRCIASRNGVDPNPSYNDSVDTIPPAVWIAPTDLYDFIQNNNGTRAKTVASFWRPRQYTFKGQVFYPLGDLVIGPRRLNEEFLSRKKIGNMVLPNTSVGPARTTMLVAGNVQGPIDYELMWTNSGQIGNKFWVWRPIAPAGYIALGDIITPSASKPSTGNSAPIRCIPNNMAIRINPNGGVLYSSMGMSGVNNMNLLGFNPNNGRYTNAADGNAYNLFRCVIGWGTYIPDTDVNGSFYYIDPSKRLSIGNEDDKGNPEHSNKSKRLGKGYVDKPQRDSKYSVLAYLQLKNNPVLTHIQSTTQLKGQIIDNAIGNTFTIAIGDKCLSVINGVIKMEICDNEKDSQYFSILLTGNMPNQARIKHKSTGKFLKYKQGMFSLHNEGDATDQEYLMYSMS
jgi:hypothetical protein